MKFLSDLFRVVGAAVLSIVAVGCFFYIVELANSREVHTPGSVAQVQKFPDLEGTPAIYLAYIHYDNQTHEVRRLTLPEFRNWGRPLMRVVLHRRVGTFGSEISREYELVDAVP